MFGVNLKDLVLNATARLLSVLLRVVPTGSHTLVYGMPSTEGNAVEVVRALVRLTDAEIVWPGAPPTAYLDAVGIPAARVRRLASTRSIAAVWAFLRAKAIFHTHGLYGCPIPSSRHPIVNVWHGDSFKLGRHFPNRTLRGPNATYIVASSHLMGAIKAELAETSPSRLLIVGNPRVAQMFSPPSQAQLESLGLDTSRPFVVWMPTFRVARDKAGNVAWSNTTNKGSDLALANVATAIAKQLEQAGITLVVKPHMFDATNRDVPGAVILDNDGLERQGVPLYGLLGASAGLISDYSSVWIDYLAVDRPIGFLVNDLEDFRGGRGIAAPELIAQYPGERLDSPQGVAEFIEDINSGGALGRPRRERFMNIIGYKASASSAEDVVRVALKM